MAKKAKAKRAVSKRSAAPSFSSPKLHKKIDELSNKFDVLLGKIDAVLDNQEGLVLRNNGQQQEHQHHADESGA